LQSVFLFVGRICNPSSATEWHSVLHLKAFWIATMTPVEQVPSWVLRPLPANAAVDSSLHQRIEQLADQLPGSLADLDKTLDEVRMFREYDAAANLAGARLWLVRERLLSTATPKQRRTLVGFVTEHLPERARAWLLRRLVRDRDRGTRDAVRRALLINPPREVSLPARRDGDWDVSGWLRDSISLPLSRHPQGRRVQERQGVPVLTTVKQLRTLLGIRSSKQLGHFLLASDQGDGPYTRFSIPKRSGGERVICAPKKQLRWVQRQILEKILQPVPVHDAAHGFVCGRSTVTNAAPHLGATLLLKFDLQDFFPTVRMHRVLGLFTRLGYHAGAARFRADDTSREIAPVLARLCCYTPDPRLWGEAVLPQGAPTSPAITNLICRRLDARLTGLAQRNQGTYTRYADDLTFSFRHQELDLGRFRWWVDQICHQEGFLVHQDKFRVIRRSQRQLVTGIVINDSLRVPRDERRRFRAILHNCRAHGVDSQARGHPRFREYLRGFACYVHMVHPEEGNELLQQVDELLGPDDPSGASS
jgi:RNA-directed DNA polymerase